MSTAVSPPSDTPPRALSPGAASGLRRLEALVASVRRQARGWVWVEGIALVAIVVAASFWATMAFDRAVEPPAWTRAALALAVVAVLAAVARRFLFERLATPMGDASVATLVERGNPGFRDSLSTAIELAARPREGVDATLLERTIDEAAAGVDRVDPRRLFRRGRLLATALLGALALATVAGMVLSRPAVAGLWARRLFLLDDTPWPRRVRLRAEGFVDGVRTVARGSDVDLLVAADATGEIPDVIEVRFRPARGGAWRSERMGARGGVAGDEQAFGHVVKGVTEDLEVEIRGGDARLRGLRLAAVDAPALERVEVTATLPEYLGGGTRAVPSSRIVAVPRGATVDLVFHATKPLAAASVAVGTADGQGTGPLLATLEPGAPPEGTPPDSIAARVGPFDGERTLVVRFTDVHGLDNRDPIAVILTAIPDEPPRVAVRMRGISTAVTPVARIPLVGSISDDHGLASAAANLAVGEGAATAFPIGRIRAGATVAELGDDAPEVVALEPLGVAVGSTLVLRVSARDACTLDGGANEGVGDAWTLSVVSPEALMAMLEAREILLRRRFESVVSDLALARERLAAAAAGGDAAAPGADGDADGEGDPDGGDAAWPLEAGRLAESASRAAGETADIAEAFRAIRAELDNNALLTSELDTRLGTQIAAPLGTLATGDLPALAAAARGAAPEAREAILRRTDEVLARMRAVLDKMMELESYNEVIEILRGVIRTQEEIRSETLKRQRQRAKEVLERP